MHGYVVYCHICMALCDVYPCVHHFHTCNGACYIFKEPDQSLTHPCTHPPTWMQSSHCCSCCWGRTGRQTTKWFTLVAFRTWTNNSTVWWFHGGWVRCMHTIVLDRFILHYSLVWSCHALYRDGSHTLQVEHQAMDMQHEAESQELALDISIASHPVQRTTDMSKVSL